jgi:hypothetical protein
MFVRICQYFPFSARVCLNQHHWLAIRMQPEGIDFHQSANANCGNPRRWQELAGCQHRLFFRQVEYGYNLIFYRRAAGEELTQRLLEPESEQGQTQEDHHHLRSQSDQGIPGQIAVGD